MNDAELRSLERLCSKDDLSDSNVATLTTLGLKAAAALRRMAGIADDLEQSRARHKMCQDSLAAACAGRDALSAAVESSRSTFVPAHLSLDMAKIGNIIAERDSAQMNFMGMMNLNTATHAELDALGVAQDITVIERVRLLAANLQRVTAERDEARERLRVSDELRAVQDDTVELNVAEQIADWLDEVAWNDDGFEAGDGDISEQTAALIAADIRNGAYRATKGGE